MLSARHITTACFFAVIYYLLIINWSWAAEPDYKLFTKTIESNTKRTRSQNEKIIDVARMDVKRPGRKDRLSPYLNKMEKIRLSTDSLYEYIDRLKIKLNKIPKSSKSKRQVLAFITQHHLDSLNKLLDAHLESSISLTENYSFRERFSKTLDKHWNANPHLTLNTSAGLESILTVFQEDIINNESEILRQLSIESSDFGCGFGNSFHAIAYLFNSFVQPGQKVKATIFIATYNQLVNPTIQVNKGHIQKVENAVGSWARSNSPLGINTVIGTATIKTDSVYTRPWHFQYFVAAPGICMNLDNVNTCYLGVNNPITVSVPGFEDEKLTLKVKGATVTKTAAGKFNIYFNSQPKEDVYAFVEGTNSEGTTSTVASLPLKVVELPTPVATIDGAEDGYIHVRQFRNAEGLSAILKNSDFDMRYTIVSYKLSLFHNRNSMYIQPVNGKGAHFNNSPAVLKILDIARRGDRAIFEEIIAKDENGRTVELAPLMLKVD